ncbi:MAG: hypothetical protein R3300_00365 [Candidatus Promineifilaceae bacterium]|nr:hypothetical protein [Candidatus Promineifilaceae bacterium]
MSRTVKLKVRPGEVVRFPAVCVHCGQPATAQMTLSHQEGRVTRLLGAPLCAACAQIANNLTASEQRLQQIGWLAAGLTGLLVLAVILLALPPIFPPLLQLVAALVLVVVAVVVVQAYFRRRGRTVAPPAKQAVRGAADLTDFSWRTITLTFTNEAVAQDFAELNRSDLMEI